MAGRTPVQVYHAADARRGAEAATIIDHVKHQPVVGDADPYLHR
jgi:hypothetical protein